ncbi:hypothetical protein ONZ45_g10846 [Pleurotus djamor]|nr:hypothetical protein ONZ45_g10846 [Pleurotus djamor]
MARTKQTARQSTGAPAVGKSLPPCHFTPDTLPTLTPKSVAKDGAVDVIRSETAGARNSLCRGCQNGGKLIQCNQCQRWICVEVDGGSQDADDAESLVQEDDDEGGTAAHRAIDTRTVTTERTPLTSSVFIRFSSIDANIPLAQGFFTPSDEPLKVVVRVSQPWLFFFPEMECQETVILLIALRGTEDLHEPIAETFHRFKGFFGRDQGHLWLITVAFDLHSDPSKYATNINEALAIAKGRSAKRVLTYVVTHSTAGGLLHYSAPVPSTAKSPGYPAYSTNPQELLDRLFPNHFKSYLMSLDRSTLFLLVCRGIEGHVECKEWVKAAVRFGTFGEVISFSAPRFQPFWATTFCVEFFRRVYLEGQRWNNAMNDVLAGDPRLGASTPIVVAHRPPHGRAKVELTKFFWSHPTRAPSGLRIPTSCPKCKRFGTVSVKDKKRSSVKFRCCAKLSSGGKCGWKVSTKLEEEVVKVDVLDVNVGKWLSMSIE